MQLIYRSCLLSVVLVSLLADAKVVPRAWGRNRANTTHTTQRSASTLSPVASASATGLNHTGTGTSVAAGPTSTVALNAAAVNCLITVPVNPLSAQGLATPWLLQPPCSMSVVAQQAFVEAAVYDPATGGIGIYHPLVSDASKTPAVPPVVPTLPANAMVGLWLGFNGGVLQMVDQNGLDTNQSPSLKSIDCVNGLPGVTGDAFGQVSWCNAQAWFTAANAGVAAGLVTIPALGMDKLGNSCPTSRSFEIVDACPSDNVPTQYLLTSSGQTAQDTAANKKALAGEGAEVINNASDEALLANIIDPLIGCTPFQAPNLDNPGVMSNALALSELQAAHVQAEPIGLIPLNDPDTLLTSNGAVSTAKTNAYRLGVNQPVIASSTNASDPTGTSGALVPFCSDMIAIAPPFFAGFQSTFIGQTSPAANVGTNLFTFLCERYLMSLTQLTCPPAAFQPVVCQIDANTGAATSCVITLPKTATATSGTMPTRTETGTGRGQKTGGNGGNGGTGSGKGIDNGFQPSLSSSAPTSSTEPVSPCSMSPSPSSPSSTKVSRRRHRHRME